MNGYWQRFQEARINRRRILARSAAAGAAFAAVGVVGCSSPVPAGTTTCTDVGGVPRGARAVFFYQVRCYCDAANEGP